MILGKERQDFSPKSPIYSHKREQDQLQPQGVRGKSCPDPADTLPAWLGGRSCCCPIAQKWQEAEPGGQLVRGGFWSCFRQCCYMISWVGTPVRTPSSITPSLALGLSW